MKEHRLQKLISQTGFCSRRKAEKLIKENRVLVNEKIALIGDKANLSVDKIRIDGVDIGSIVKTKVLLLNKPTGVISSCFDPQGRKTVLDLIPNKLRKGIYPVGRLDFNSRGAILLTNNGLLSLKLTHPRYKHRKTYKVLLNGSVSSHSLRKWKSGVIINGKKTNPTYINYVSKKPDETLIELVLTEGRNRQIRKTAELLGHRVLDLQRTSIENLSIIDLPEGEWRELSHDQWIHILERVE